MGYVPIHTSMSCCKCPMPSVGFWQCSFKKEIHDYDPACPNLPEITSPDGGEQICSRYFTITWTEADPTDPDKDCGDCVWYNIDYSTDNGQSWIRAVDYDGEDMTMIPEGTTSIVWDLGDISDTDEALIRICPVDSYGCECDCDESDAIFTICGGVCF